MKVFEEGWKNDFASLFLYYFGRQGYRGEY